MEYWLPVLRLVAKSWMRGIEVSQPGAYPDLWVRMKEGKRVCLERIRQLGIGERVLIRDGIAVTSFVLPGSRDIGWDWHWEGFRALFVHWLYIILVSISLNN